MSDLVVVMMYPSGGACMRVGESDCPKRLGISPGYHSPGTHLRCQCNHRSIVGLLLLIFDRREGNIQPSPLHFHGRDSTET